ncbi:WecB/TagA/CpsF family glycosyltransferase [Candidatus Pelagibacter sp.]|nr:WecB/TagA/CpsF family glycosyltransferase [Candidatus Pelagibacter sp.]
MKRKIIKFHNIKFYNNNFNFIFKLIMNGGYLVAPAASALSKIFENKSYHQSLVHSNVAILDSGFFCILLRILKFEKVEKMSGYRFLKKFLNKKEIKNKKILCIDPTLDEARINKKFLTNLKFKNVLNYTAPFYKKGNITDSNLVNKINKIKPRIIIINIGGEIQEILASYIIKKLKFKVTIICTGAAIGFLTGTQAPINNIIDKIYLGWLFRILYNPRKFFLRTIKSFSLIKLFI